MAADVQAGELEALLDDLDGDRMHGSEVGRRLCAAFVDLLDVSGAGIMLMSNGEHRGSLAVSDAVMGVIEELQYTLGEGPCVDACSTLLPVMEPDLLAPSTARWPAFTGPAVEAGVRALFGFPLVSGASTIGALDLYLDRPGALDPRQVTDAGVLADVVSWAVLAIQSDAPSGQLASELGTVLDRRAVVHQAAGMVSAQLEIAVRDALVRIRARSYLDSRPVNEVARDIVQRRLRFD